MIISVKSMEKFCDKVFERVNGGISQCVTPMPYMPFKHVNEQPTTNIHKGDVVLYEKLKKMTGIFNQGCFTLAIKFKMWQVINDIQWHL